MILVAMKSWAALWFLCKNLISDLRASPKLVDSPINYLIDRNRNLVIIENNSFKIISEIISSYESPNVNQIERLKIIQILKKGLQVDSTDKMNRYK